MDLELSETTLSYDELLLEYEKAERRALRSADFGDTGLFEYYSDRMEHIKSLMESR